MTAGPLQEAMEEKLGAAFAPERMEVINESHLHAGHQGGAMDGTGETHFRVRLVSTAFAGKSRVDRHRAINQVLAAELADGVHALALELAAPGEATRW